MRARLARLRAQVGAHARHRPQPRAVTHDPPTSSGRGRGDLQVERAVNLGRVEGFESGIEMALAAVGPLAEGYEAAISVWEALVSASDDASGPADELARCHLHVSMAMEVIERLREQGAYEMLDLWQAVGVPDAD